MTILATGPARGDTLDDAALADTEPAPALEPLSVAARLDSFGAVSAALVEERRRVAELEARLAALEKGAAEPLPAPAPDGPTQDSRKETKRETTKEGKQDDKKKAAEPYEVGSDLTMPLKWIYGLQGESPHKDFRVKVGGRVQFDNVAFSQGDGPARKPADGGLAPPLRDATAFRRAVPHRWPHVRALRLRGRVRLRQ